MLKEEMLDALNEHLNAELYSSYLYLAMAAYLESKNLTGLANWMSVQVQEENLHAMKFYRFINDRGGRVRLRAIEQPPLEWDSPLALFRAVYEHECHVSELVYKLVDLARELRDHPTENFLQWFVSEQVEEEAAADAIVKQLEMVGDDVHGLFMMDRELGQRVFNPAADEGE